MIKLNLTCKVFFLAVVLSFLVLPASAANRFSVATGNWNANSTWSALSGGAPGASFPVAGDVVFIENGNSITVTANAACASITYPNQATNPTLTVNATFTLTVSGAVTIREFEGVLDGVVTISGGGSLVCASVTLGESPYNPGAKAVANQSITSTIATFNISGNLNLLSPYKAPNRYRNAVFNFDSGIVTVGGSVTSTNENAGNVSTLTMATGAQTGTLILSGATPFSLSATGTNTITLNGTSALVNYNRAGAQTVYATTYNNLTLSGSGAKTVTGATVNGILSMEGTATTAGASPAYGAAATLQYKGSASQTTGVEFPATFSGTGGVIINNINGVLLSGSHTINSSLTLTSGAFSLGANTLTLSNGSNLSYGGGSLTGGATSNLIIGTGANITLNAISGGLSNFNTGRNITLGADLSVNGTLTLTAGALSIAANTLTLANGSNLSYGGGSLTGGATSNLTIGTGANITLNAISGGLNNFNTSRNITLGADLSLNGTLTLTAGTFTVGAYTLTLNGPTIAGTPANLATTASSSLIFGGTTAGVLIPTSVVALNGLSITNTSIVTLQSSLTVSGTFNPAGAGLSIGANTLTLNGQINCGTLVGGATSNIIIGGAGTANLPAVTLNNLTINRAVTMCGNVTVGGTLTLTSGALSIAVNTLTLSNGSNLSYGGGSLTGGATSNLTIGTGANITLNAISGGLNNFNTSRNITLGADLSVNGTLTLTAGALSIGANTLTLANGSNLSYGAGSLTGGATSNLTIGTGANITLNSISGGLNNFNTSRNIILGADLSVNGTLTLTAGTFTVGAYTLTFQNSNIPIVRTSGTITTASNSNLSFGSSGNTGGNAFTLPVGTFTSPPFINNLSIYRTNSLTLNEQMISLNGILLCNGPLNTNGNLTLLSTAGGTALIDGSGTGQVTGNVTMQRYLTSGFGYKYFSSPFQAATVSEFGDDMDLLASFPTFYEYDESRVSAGWVNYTNPVGVLNPLYGYAVNFGSNVAATTADVTGVVNNGILSRTMFNNNMTYTKGFNLVGNPYPSPIDWDAAAGWTKTNIDNALYYFKAGGADEYSGTYSTYIGGVSSDGLATKIIPSMQGFFVHVTDGAWPVTGTLALNNSVRVTDMTHSFIKSDGANIIPLLRLTAGFSDDPGSLDPMVIYFDEKASVKFDSQRDALKLMNTDIKVPNLYAVSSDGYKLSINALPLLEDSLLVVPLGLKTSIDGSITFRIKDISDFLSGSQIYLYDDLTKADQNLDLNKVYTINLYSGEYNNRFYLRFIKGSTDIPEIRPDTDLFTIYNSHGALIADITLLPGKGGTLIISNISGQIVFRKEIYEGGYHEFNPELKTGIYIVNFITGNTKNVKKIFIFNK